MTRYTDGFGRCIVICDQCRSDIIQEDSVLTLVQATVKDGFTTRDYDQSEIVLCKKCANTVSHVLAITGTRYADSLTVREAA